MFLPLRPPPVNRYFSDENDGLLPGNYSASSSSSAAAAAVGRSVTPSREAETNLDAVRSGRPSVLIGFGNQSSSSTATAAAAFVN